MCTRSQQHFNQRHSEHRQQSSQQHTHTHTSICGRVQHNCENTLASSHASSPSQRHLHTLLKLSASRRRGGGGDTNDDGIVAARRASLLLCIRIPTEYIAVVVRCATYLYIILAHYCYIHYTLRARHRTKNRVPCRVCACVCVYAHSSVVRCFVGGGGVS